MLSKHEEQSERMEILRNEKRLRNQGSTFSQLAESDATTPLGRFSAISSPHVVGSESIPKYPAAFLQHDPVPDEPKLGIDINEMPTCGEPHEIRASLASLEPASPGRSSHHSSAQETQPNPVPHAPPPTPPETGKRAAELGSFSSRTFRRA
jgi:hypothetical protein